MAFHEENRSKTVGKWWFHGSCVKIYLLVMTNNIAIENGPWIYPGNRVISSIVIEMFTRGVLVGICWYWLVLVFGRITGWYASVGVLDFFHITLIINYPN